MNLPNGISLLRILLIPLLVVLLLSTNLFLNSIVAVTLFSLIALTDMLDGYLARKLKQETNLGRFLDPLADKLLVISALICLVEKGTISSVPVLIIIIRDFSVSGLRMMAASAGKVIAADWLGKYKAAILDLAVIMLIIGLPGSALFLWTGVILTVISGIHYFEKNRKILND